jgi:uncharacterized surface protein with fasciclin (FAS1) repeats
MGRTARATMRSVVCGVTTASVNAQNGVIHTIDEVLLPQPTVSHKGETS